MKHHKKLIAVLLVLTMALTGLAFGTSAADASTQTKSAAPLFGAKFEGDQVAGTAEFVDGVYRVTATRTDREAWHIKLECNYPTVTGHEYRVTYRFRSNVAGTVKFGDLQEFKISKGDNKLSGLVIAKDGTSYLDLQLGALGPFTIDFSEIEVVEMQDDVSYESVLPGPLELDGEDVIMERHDPEYGPLMMCRSDSVTVNYFPVSHDPAVWKARLYVRTGVTPQPGVRYRVSADLLCDEDMDYEVLLNRDEQEKGYGALYGRHLTGGELTTVEQILTLPESGFADGELVLQFSLGCAPEDVDVTVSNVCVEKVTDKYTNQLPAGFALTKQVYNGKTYTTVTPTDHRDVPLTRFSYSGTDTVFERHDDDYEVNFAEAAGSAKLSITKAPAEGRGVWKVKLYADTGVTPEAGVSYRIKYDLSSSGNQAEYEACFDGDYENAYGALYGRSLTAGGTDHVEQIVTPDVSHGPLILRLQLGKTDSTAGNTFTLKNLSVEKLAPVYQPVGDVTFSAGGDGNVWEEHSDGIEQTVSASGSTATLTASAARSEGGVWSSRLFVNTGVVPEAGAKYRVMLTMNAAKAVDDFEIVCDKGGAENGYAEGKRVGLSLPAGADTAFTTEFTAPSDGCEVLTLRFQLGNTPADNTITVRDIQVCKVTGGEWTNVELSDFAYPVTTGGEPAVIPAGYSEQGIALSMSEAHDEGYVQTLEGNSLNISAIPTPDVGVWSSKLFVDTGVTPENGAKYKVTASVSSEKAMDFEICFNSGDVEKGYGALYGQSIAAGESKSFFFDFDVSADASAGRLVLQLQVGRSPAPNTITVSSVKVEKVIPEHGTPAVEPAGYQAVALSGLSASDACDDGYGQELSGMTLTISTIPESDTGVWKSKLFVDTQTVLEAGTKYRVTASMTAARGMDFEICFNSGSAEKGYGALYGLNIGDGETRQYVCEFDVAADAAPQNLVLQFQLGNSPADNTITVNSVTLEKWIPEQESTITVPESSEELPVSLSAWEQHADGFDQSVSGTALTINAIPALDLGVWQSKLFADTQLTPDAGTKYRVTASLSSTQAMPFEICYNNGAEEKGYGALYGQSIGAGETKDFMYEFDTAADAALENLVLQFMLGKSPAGNTVTVNFVKVEKWIPEHEEQSGGSTEKNSFDLESNENALADLTGDGLSATATITNPGDDWHIKLYAKPGIELQAARTYTITMNVTGASGCAICYKNTATGNEEGFGTETAGSGTVTHTVTPDANGTLEVLLKLGTLAAGSKVTVSDLAITMLNQETIGSNLMTDSLKTAAPGNVNCWAHEDYAAALSCDGSSVDLSVLSAPDSGREFWKVKLFVETGITLEAGKHYRIRADVSADTGTDYEICYNNGAEEKGVGALYGLHAAAAPQTAEFETTAESAADLILQFNFGCASSSTNFTVSNITVEEMTDAAAENALPSFRYDSVGSFSADAGEGYLVSLSKAESSATLTIHQAPAERDAWRVKFYVNTGFTPEPGKAYVVSFDVDAAKPQSSFEVFYDGAAEAAYGQRYGLSLRSGKQTVSQIIYPNSGSGVLTLQLRCGKTDGTDGNSYSVSNVKIQSVNLRYNTIRENEETASLRTEPGYSGTLSRTAKQASVRLFSCPEGNQEPWKTKLFIPTGVSLRAGQKYRVSFEVFSNADVPYELCLNRNGLEKGFGARYGMTATYTPQVVEYIFYASEDGYLELQFSLGNAAAPCTFTVSSVKVEKAAGTSRVSDTIYTF